MRKYTCNLPEDATVTLNDLRRNMDCEDLTCEDCEAIDGSDLAEECGCDLCNNDMGDDEDEMTDNGGRKRCSCQQNEADYDTCPTCGQKIIPAGDDNSGLKSAMPFSVNKRKARRESPLVAPIANYNTKEVVRRSQPQRKLAANRNESPLAPLRLTDFMKGR